jgi:hypothetical protein
VATGLASGISETGATLQATVNPQGQATTYHFNYGPTTAYGSVLPSPDASAGSGNTGQPVQQALTGLTPGTEYHFQIAASSAGGTSYGADETFATPATASNPEAADEVLPEHVERTLFEIYDGIRERDLTQSGYPLASYAAEMLEAEGHDKISVSAMHASFDRWLHRRFRQHRIRIAMLEPKEEAEDEELLTEVERAAERRRVPHELLFEIFENLPEEAFTKDDPRYPLVNPVRERTPTGYLRPTRDEIRAAYQVWLQRIAE